MFRLFFLMCAVTMFHQEVELKYHQLCQGDQEAATSEDGNNHGGVPVCRWQSRSTQEAQSLPLLFQTGFSDEEVGVRR